MSKNIILLSDGTGNSNIKDRGTNVFKLYEAIDFNCCSIDSKEQVAFYDDGVGTEHLKPLKTLGSAFGFGLTRNVRDLYKHLVQAYNPGDKIFLFGFSRGAFTVRTLAGFIANKGILNIADYPDDAELEAAVFRLYQSYRANNMAILERIIHILFGKSHNNVDKQKLIIYTDKELNLQSNKLIEFIGVWDTVDAVGLPFDEATYFWNKFVFRFKFPDLVLHSSINKACHSLSIDDERSSFHPLLWQNDSRIEQVWFPGVHSNVGGGYPQQGLSLVTLEWMMEKASAVGLRFVPTDKQFVHDRKYVLDKLYNSRSGLGVYYRYKPRNIGKICSDNGITTPQIHVSAFQRIAAGIFGYAPRAIPTNFDIVDNIGVHSNSRTIQNLFNQNLVANKIVTSTSPNQSPLLNKTAHFIFFRNSIYYVFLCYSIVTMYWLIADDINNEGIIAAIKKLSNLDSLLEKLASLFWHNSLLTLGGILIFVCALGIRLKMSSFFSKFWSQLRSQIKPLV